MPVMTLMLLAPVLPIQFPLLNLSVRNGDDFCCQSLESLEWRFGFWWLGGFHGASIFHAQPKRNLRLSRDFDLYRFLVVDDYGNRFPVCMKARNIGSGLPHGWHTDKDQNHHGEDSSKQKRIEISEQCVHPASYATA
jgi:hypothetical protein